ncbi:MAG: hypothetical protein HGA45_42525 [Chloroflexales bacterium]|nr:hypothetical protein [Chloroflexales bacterium]
MTTWDLALPDGARIVPLSEQLALTTVEPVQVEGVLGATNAPSGAVFYGGSDLEIFESADRTAFVIYCGERGAGYKFGTYCVRYWPDGRWAWVELPSFTEGRVGVQERPDGLYYSFPSNDGHSWTRSRVPGYVTPGWPTNGQTVVAPVSIVTTPAPGQFLPVDQTARDQVAALKKTVADLSTKLTQLAARAAGLTEGQVDDRLWAKFPDALFYYLRQASGGYLGELQRIVAETVERLVQAK